MSAEIETEVETDLEHFKNLLTPEEREAIDDNELSGDDREALSAIVGDSADDDSDDHDDHNDQSGSDDSGDQDKNAQADNSDPSDDNASEEGVDDEEVKPKGSAEAEKAPNVQNVSASYQASDPGDLSEQFAAIRAEKKALAGKLQSGELDEAAYHEQMDVLDERRDALSAARIKADISREMQAQSLEQQWASSVSRFVSSVANDIDYVADEAKRADLDGFVRVLSASPQNQDKSFDWFLAEAHKRVKALYGVPDQTPAPQTAQKTPVRRKPPLESVPKTLAHVPGSDGPGDVGSEFAELDNLDGPALEEALRRMTPAQRERYARGE